MGLARRSPAPRRLRLEASAWTSLAVLVALLVAAAVFDAGVVSEGHTAGSGRRLSAYPDDPVIDRPYGEASNRGLIFLHIIGIAYMLMGLNTVCDVYFCASLDEMVERWHVKPDVAGATFMAAGGSAPELFTSLLGTLVTQNDVGFGTIVGSAIFNVLFVIGLCGWTAKDEIKLTWWPLFRDCTSYMIGLAFLAWVASDERVQLWEALMLFSLYVLYCVLMYNNTRVEAVVKAALTPEFWRTNRKVKTSAEPLPITTTQVVPVKPHTVEPTAPFISPVVPCAWGENEDTASRYVRQGIGGISEKEGASSAGAISITDVGNGHLDQTEVVVDPEDELVVRPTASGTAPGSDESPTASTLKTVSVAFKEREPVQELNKEPRWVLKHSKSRLEDEPIKEEEGAEEEEEEDEDLLAWPTGGLKDKIVWCISLPVYVPLYFTIPSSPKWFLVTFGLSLMWIAFFSFFMVWWVEILGEVCHINPIIMGYTLLAAGTSVPDAVSSVAVARKGEADMSVSSSIGSNIFDILVGLPIPWTIKMVIDLVAGRTSEVRILSPYLTFFVVLLLFMVFAVVLIIHCIGWKLSRTLGVFMACLYAVFLALGVTVEFTEPVWLRF